MHKLERFVAVLEPGGGRLEVARIGEPVGADRAEIGQAEGGAEILGDIAGGAALGQQHAEADAAGNDGDLAGGDVDPAELGQ